MEMTGEHVIPAPRDKVWEMLNDPAVLRACIPGCTELEGSPEQGFTATVKQSIGPVKATFKGEVTLSDLNPPESYTISGSGKGGVAGFAKGGADIRLSDAEQGTRLRYDVRAQVGGKLAQLGSRLVDSTAKRLAGQFFSNLEDHALSRHEAGTVNATAARPAEDTRQAPASAGSVAARPRMLILLAATAVLIVGLLFAFNS
ncbi:CoxG family protein [Alkalilacustris brevis]|uniref:CoxG family protein n=1 Tax=Alkalilacustris brevis TaxID=2026338 RepID=UPI000E0E0055|nr:carbon monoxide dehydrogenase subunit G [Alkalilacustris brevis]